MSTHEHEPASSSSTTSPARSGAPAGRAATWRALRRVLAGVAIAYAGVCALAFVLQERLVFFPGPPPQRTPADRGLMFEDVRLGVDGEQLHLWWIPAQRGLGGDAEGRSSVALAPPAPAPRGAVLFCHGNAGSIEQRIDAAAGWAARGFDVALFDYRGYGASDGTPSEAGFYADARAVHAHVTGVRGHPADRVLVYGRSLGGAVAIELAAARTVAGVVVESTFTSLPDVGAVQYPFLPVRLLGRLAFDSAAHIASIDAPLFAAHGRADRIVPFASGAALFERAVEPKTFVELAGGHNGRGIEGTDDARAALEVWLERVLPRR